MAVVIFLVAALLNFKGCLRKYMESTNIKFAKYGGANECAKTDMLLLLLSEISTGAVSL